MRIRGLAVVAAMIVIGSMLGAAPSSAATSPYAPVNRPGPKLTVPTTTLKAGLTCTANLKNAKRTPVLLVHGTGVSPEENWSFIYKPALTKLGVPFCIVRMPQRATGDIQVNAEYVVWSIRQMHAKAHRKISIIGASQGGMIPRWGLRFWPDLRPMVDDVIGLAPSNHGTPGSLSDCMKKGCQPAGMQQYASSKFMAALNSRQETFKGISYTNIYTHNDEVVKPNKDDTGSSSLHGGGGRITNVAIQDICPIDPSEHLLLGAADPIGYSLAWDALTHAGPASVARVEPAGCAQPLIPAIDPLTEALNLPSLIAGNFLGVGAAAKTLAEPKLRCYTKTHC